VRQALTQVLEQAHQFGDEELQANRSGGLTTRQRNFLLRKTLWGTLPVLFSLVFALAVIYPSLAAGRLPDSLSVLAIPLAMAAFLVASGGLAVYKGLADALSGAVESTQGIGRKSIEKRSSGRSQRMVYLYNIGDWKFEVPKSAHPALIDGAEYRISFTPRTRRLLTIEAIGVPGIAPFGE
jgi:hypothetical protein